MGRHRVRSVAVEGRRPPPDRLTLVPRSVCDRGSRSGPPTEASIWPAVVRSREPFTNGVRRVPVLSEPNHPMRPTSLAIGVIAADSLRAEERGTRLWPPHPTTMGGIMVSQPAGRASATGEARRAQMEAIWGEGLIHRILYPFASFAAPAFLLVLLVFFIWRAFTVDLPSGLRSFAAALLPLMIVTYMTTARRSDLSRRTAQVPSWLTFVVMLGVGAALMPIVSISGSVPVAELVLSGCFSVLVGGYVLIEDRDKTMSYYFGLILGVLGSVVLAGLPHL